MIDAELFDIAGIFVFAYIIFLSILMLKNKGIKKWMKFTLLAIGLLGILVDGYIVIGTYILNG